LLLYFPAKAVRLTGGRDGFIGLGVVGDKGRETRALILSISIHKYWVFIRGKNLPAAPVDRLQSKGCVQNPPFDDFHEEWSVEVVVSEDRNAKVVEWQPSYL
jgi:hypothetical protein